MAHAELMQAAAGEVTSPRPRSLAAWLEASLAMMVEIPAALLVMAEIVILFAGVVARYGGRRQCRARNARLPRPVRNLRRAGFSAADRVAGLRIRLRREFHHHAG